MALSTPPAVVPAEMSLAQRSPVVLLAVVLKSPMAVLATLCRPVVLVVSIPQQLGFVIPIPVAGAVQVAVMELPECLLHRSLHACEHCLFATCLCPHLACVFSMKVACNPPHENATALSHHHLQNHVWGHATWVQLPAQPAEHVAACPSMVLTDMERAEPV